MRRNRHRRRTRPKRLVRLAGALRALKDHDLEEGGLHPPAGLCRDPDPAAAMSRGEACRAALVEPLTDDADTIAALTEVIDATLGMSCASPRPSRRDAWLRAGRRRRGASTWPTCWSCPGLAFLAPGVLFLRRRGRTHRPGRRPPGADLFRQPLGRRPAGRWSTWPDPAAGRLPGRPHLGGADPVLHRLPLHPGAARGDRADQGHGRAVLALIR